MQAWNALVDVVSSIPEPVRITVLATTGVLLLARGAALGRQAWALRTSPVPMLRRAARGFGFGVLAVGALGLAAGWALDSPWVGTVAVVFALEELWEATFLAGAMRWAEENGWPGTPPEALPGASPPSTAPVGPLA